MKKRKMKVIKMPEIEKRKYKKKSKEKALVF